ncbi:MAG: phosphatase PAP2 family protein [Aquabacterium sp.]|uniref:phosphatase PAP2 family protein n=1 Tax=Aquabacterium sp. TaxID=1872578 RepID=UPI0011F7F4AB|nr:phosphatase PAP2 family protein [Aquabacterium sp.]TAK90684.1 MAG: phosphatase PAP2 family protein [Aquabacterium sp.]
MNSEIRRRSLRHLEEPAPDELDTKLIWAGLFFSLAIFAQFPGVDLLVSVNYWNAEQGFFHRNDPVVRALYDWTPLLGRTLVAVLALFAMLAPLIARILQKRGREEQARNTLGPWRHLATLSVCCALLGNGLVIEGLCKGLMGRPRPVQVVQFGGADVYHGPFTPGRDTANHRSFVSSHAAAGFALMSLGLTCGPVWRRRWLLIGTMAGAAIGFGRMLQGGHFLSDIIFAFYGIWLSCELVAWADRKRLSRSTP